MAGFDGDSGERDVNGSNGFGVGGRAPMGKLAIAIISTSIAVGGAMIGAGIAVGGAQQKLEAHVSDAERHETTDQKTARIRTVIEHEVNPQLRVVQKQLDRIEEKLERFGK